MQQKIQEEFLRKREQELAEREIDLLERELNIMILQQQQGRPTPKKRKGKFKKSRLKLLKSGGQISMPCGKMHHLNCISVINLFAIKLPELEIRKFWKNLLLQCSFKVIDEI